MDSREDLDGSKEMDTTQQEETQNTVIGDSQATVSSRKRRRKLTSEVWNHFTRISETQVQCDHCKQTYTQRHDAHGTSTMKRHVEHLCRKKPLCLDLRSVIRDAEGNVRITKKWNQKIAEEKLTKFIVTHDLPFTFVEYDGLRDWINYMVPDFKFCGRNTMATRVEQLYLDGKERMKSDLEKIPSRISLTSDCWTGIDTVGYICLTAHYVDEDWKLTSKILSFIDLPHPHTGEALATKIHDLLKEWGIEKKIFTITLDNASANDCCQEILKERLCLDNNLLCDGEFFHIRCCAHILNLIVQDGLKTLGDAVSKIRDSVRYVKASKGRMDVFESCIEGGGSAVLTTDVPTRWNSAFIMLEKALKYQRAFARLKVIDKGYKHCPSSEEWGRAERICELLQPFYKITVLMSGSTYCTSNLYFGQIFKIEKLLKKNVASSDDHIRMMSLRMLDKFNKYWEHYSVILAMGAIVDPRFKLQFLRRCWNELDGESANEKLEFLKTKLYMLYKEYQTIVSDKLTTTTNASSSRNVTTPNASSSRSVSTIDILDDYFDLDDPDIEGERERSYLDIYLDEERLRVVDFHDLDVLGYWRDNRHRMPDVALMAADILSIPITTVASESSFSIGSRILNKYRNQLLPSSVQSLICARSWYKGFSELTVVNNASGNQGDNGGGSDDATNLN